MFVELEPDSLHRRQDGRVPSGCSEITSKNGSLEQVGATMLSGKSELCFVAADRRSWDALYAQRRQYVERVHTGAALSVWYHIKKLLLRRALGHCKRWATLLTIQEESRQLPVQHRAYLLRKLLLKSYWHSLASACQHWVAVCRAFAKVRQRTCNCKHRQLMRLAWKRWRLCIYKEQLEEEVAGHVSVVRTRRINRSMQNSVQKRRRERLLAAWVLWRRSGRRQRCRAWRRGMSLAMRKYFISWRKVVEVERTRRQCVEDGARSVLWAIVDDCLALSTWREQRLQLQHDATSKLRRVFATLYKQRLCHGLARWKQLTRALPPPTTTSQEPPSPETQRSPTFPQRFVRAYRAQRRQLTVRKPVSSTRPHWR